MNENCLEKLEYNKVLDLLSKNSVTYLGKQLSLNLLPTFKKNRVIKLLQERKKQALVAEFEEIK